MKSISVKWSGKAVGVNQWKAYRGVMTAKGPRAIVYETKEYREFKQSFSDAFIGQKAPTGYVDVQIFVELHKRADTDGVIKPILDAVEASGVIENDNLVRHVFVWRGYHRHGLPDRIELKIKPVEELISERR